MEGPFSILCAAVSLSFIAFVGVVFARAIGRIDAQARMGQSRTVRRQKGRK
jgi:hypothetical protein